MDFLAAILNRNFRFQSLEFGHPTSNFRSPHELLYFDIDIYICLCNGITTVILIL